MRKKLCWLEIAKDGTIKGGSYDEKQKLAITVTESLNLPRLDTEVTRIEIEEEKDD